MSLAEGHHLRWPRSPGADVRNENDRHTSARIRQLMDGIEDAVRRGDELALARFLAPPQLRQMMIQTADIRAAGGTVAPGRAGLRWMLSRRRADGPGRCWLRLRFEDMTVCHYPDGPARALGRTHDLEVDVETTTSLWRLHRVVELDSA